MKKLIVIAAIFITTWQLTTAQEAYSPSSAGVISLESRHVDMDEITLGNILRNELIKINLFNVIDRYETMNACTALEVDPTTCIGRSCLVKVGQELKVEKMFTGSVDQYSGKIIITLRAIDVVSGEVEHNHIQEFINVQKNIPTMLGLCLQKMFLMEVDQEVWNKMTRKDDYENALNTPGITRLKLSGPRMGIGMVTGMDGSILQADKSVGGFDAWPVMSQFGYQFEASYLNEGNIQALFEFIPMISGLEQGFFIPSISILHGIRSNVSGLEFAFGPVFMLKRKAKGFEIDGQWYLKDDEHLFPDEDLNFENRLDSRGKVWYDSGLVIAVGKTFKSGKVNFPVNLYGVMKKSGVQVGLSFGFNASSSNQ